ncbi:hypothetical protein D3C85_1731670 [compost metagenome]
MLARLLDRHQHGAGERARAALGRLQKPLLGRQQDFSVGAERQHLEPALDAPGVRNAADFYGIGWQLGGFEIG